MDYDYNGALVASFMVRPILVYQIRSKQMQDDELVKEVHKIMNGDIGEDFWITQDRMLVMKGRVSMPNVDDLRKAIMEEAYCSTYAMHLGVPRCTKPLKKIIGGLV